MNNEDKNKVMKFAFIVKGFLLTLPVYLAVVNNPLAIRFFEMTYKDHEAIGLIAAAAKGFDETIKNILEET